MGDEGAGEVVGEAGEGGLGGAAVAGVAVVGAAGAAGGDVAVAVGDGAAARLAIGVAGRVRWGLLVVGVGERDEGDEKTPLLM